MNTDTFNRRSNVASLKIPASSPRPPHRNHNITFRGFAPVALLLLILPLVHCGNNANGVIKAPGVVDGDIITIKSQASGTLLKVNVGEGAVLKKGDTIAEIDADKVQNQLREVEISVSEIENNRAKLLNKRQFLIVNLAYLNRQVERFRRLKEKQAAPGESVEALEVRKKEAESSRFDIDQSLLGLDIQREKLENKRQYLSLLLKDHAVVSPVESGLVIEKFLSSGEAVTPGAALMDILNLNSLYVESYLEEQEIAGLKTGQKVRVRPDGASAPDLTGEIIFFGRKAEFSPKYIISEKERKTLLFQVKTRVNDPNGVLKVGMPVTVFFTESAAN